MSKTKFLAAYSTEAAAELICALVPTLPTGTKFVVMGGAFRQAKEPVKRAAERAKWDIKLCIDRVKTGPSGGAEVLAVPAGRLILAGLEANYFLLMYPQHIATEFLSNIDPAGETGWQFR